jgi:hypothetical protein
MNYTRFTSRTDQHEDLIYCISTKLIQSHMATTTDHLTLYRTQTTF